MPDQNGKPIVVIVEDHADIQQTLASMFSEAGYTVLTTESASKAYSAISGGNLASSKLAGANNLTADASVDLVFTDYQTHETSISDKNLPANGGELIAKLHASKPEIPCVCFSEIVSDEYAEALEARYGATAVAKASPRFSKDPLQAIRNSAGEISEAIEKASEHAHERSQKAIFTEAFHEAAEHLKDALKGTGDKPNTGHDTDKPPTPPSKPHTR